MSSSVSTRPDLALPDLAVPDLAVADLALPDLRLVTVPDGAPPYDCPEHGPYCPDRVTAGAAVAVSAPAVPVAGAPVAAVPVAAVPVAGRPAADVPGTGLPAGAVPSGATAVAVMIAETLAGVRPERQLAAHTTDRVQARIHGLGPLLRCDQRPRVLRIVASRPVARVVEMTMVVRFGGRSRALALRLEQTTAQPATTGRPGRAARWRCTALEAG